MQHESMSKARVPLRKRPDQPRRDGNATQERLLDAAEAEFCAHGFNGARTARIASRAHCNIRMLYHYFGGKEALYLVVLERVYARVRAREAALDLLHLEPAEGVTRLLESTFDHMLDHPEFIRMMAIENMLEGRQVRRSKAVSLGAQPLAKAMRRLVRRGQRNGEFRASVDPIQLYVTLLSLCYVHVSNRYTLSNMLAADLADPAWLAQRRAHVREVILGYLRS